MRAAVLVGLLTACDDRSPRRPEPPPRPSPATAATSAALPSEAPAPLSADDDAVARCTARDRAALPVALRVALADLGDDALVEDACRMDVAIRGRAPARCAALSVDVLRRSCVVRVAVASARPADCPGAVGEIGRDAVCVALAARDPGLCAAARVLERQRCLAIAAGRDAPCDALVPELRSECARGLEEWRSVLPPLAHAAPRDVDAARNGWVPSDGGATEPVPWLARGLLLVDDGSVEIVDPHTGWDDGRATDDGGFWVAVHAVPSHAPTAARAALRTPRGERLGTDEGTLAAVVHLAAVPRRRGDRVVGRVRLTPTGPLAGAPRELRFDTFVRDVVPASLLR